MSHAETLTHQLPVGFSAIELAVGARWIAARCHPNSSLARIASTFAALQSILTRAHGVVCLQGLLSDSGLELIYIPPEYRRAGQQDDLQGEIDSVALADIGRSLRREFLASNRDMVRVEANDGAQVIVYAVEVRATVLAATRIQLIAANERGGQHRPLGYLFLPHS